MQFLNWDFGQDLSTAIHVVTAAEVRFTRAERSLLQVFMSYNGRIWTRNILLDAVEGTGTTGSDRNIDYLVNRLRRKLGDSARRPRYIETRYGEGYVWVAGPSRLAPASHSALPPVRTRLRGATIMSYCDRPDDQRLVLHRYADRVMVLRLQGFLFYGAAHRVLDEVRDTVPSDVDDLVLDFRDVSGVDETAIKALRETEAVARERAIELVLSSVRPVIENKLAALTSRRFGTLDAALECRETRILRAEAVPPVAEQHLAARLAEEIGEVQSAALVSRLDTIEAPPGTELVRSGEQTREMYFIEKGTAEVMLDIDGNWVRASRIWPGTLFGEIGFHCGCSRTATVRALSACRVVRMTRPALACIETEAPQLAAALYRFLAGCSARRLVFYNDMVVDFLRSTLR